MEKQEKIHRAIFWVIAVIVAIGAIYGFTAPESEIVKNIMATPLFMKVIGIGLWIGAGFAVKIYLNSDTSGWRPIGWLIGIGLLIVFGALFLMGFGNYTY